MSYEEAAKQMNTDAKFDKFDEACLDFLYHDETAEGETSRFCKFVCAE